MSAGCADPRFDGRQCAGEIEAGRFGFASLQLGREYSDRFEGRLFDLGYVSRCVFGRPLCGQAFQQSSSIFVTAVRRRFQNGSAVVGFEQADVVGHRK